MASSIAEGSLTLSSCEGAWTAFLIIPVIEGFAGSIEVDVGAEVVVGWVAVGEMGSERH
jgi:hypothetical protein